MYFYEHDYEGIVPESRLCPIVVRITTSSWKDWVVQMYVAIPSFNHWWCLRRPMLWLLLIKWAMGTSALLNLYQLISWSCWNVIKVCRCFLPYLPYWTPLFDWCVVRWGSKNKHRQHSRFKTLDYVFKLTYLHIQQWTQLGGPMYSFKKSTIMHFW